MIKIRLPVSVEEIRKLHIGDVVSISGTMLTGRDAAHAYLAEEFRDNIAPYLKDSFIYHCGPIVRKSGDTWEFVSAGPTTSMREEMYQPDIIRMYNLRGVIGKGGMGKKTLEALREYGAVYLHAVGGAGVVAASCVKNVKGVFMLEELGTPEAMWLIEVEAFPAVVTMDSHGSSLHMDIEATSLERLKTLL